MEEKVYRFHGLDFKQVIVGALLLSIFTLSGFFAPILLFNLESPIVSAIAALWFAACLMYFGGRFLKGFWTVKFTGDIVEIYFGATLKSRFLLSELKKIHIRGWSHKKSYYLLRLTTPQGKLRIFVEGSGYMAKFTSFPEMEIFDEFVFALESYALKHKYIKKDLKKSFAHADFKNYFYLRNQNV